MSANSIYFFNPDSSNKDALTLSQICAAQVPVWGALSAASYAFGESTVQVSTFFVLALVCMGLASLLFPYKRAARPGSSDHAEVERDEQMRDWEALARAVGALQG